ncbi:MAG: Beta-galactosidase C-terminal domain [Bifidobacterium dentium]
MIRSAWPKRAETTAECYVEREGADGSRFVFSFNRTHETVRVPVEGEVVVSSFADVDGETASIKPNGVIVTKQ